MLKKGKKSSRTIHLSFTNKKRMSFPETFNQAVREGHLDLMDFFYRNGYAWDCWTGIEALSSPNPLPVLFWLLQRNYPYFTWLAYKAAEEGDIKLLNGLKLLGVSCGNDIYFHAIKSNNFKTLEWVRENCLKF